MAVDRGESRVSRRAGVEENTKVPVRAELTEALAELRRLTRDPFFEMVERVLTGLENIPAESDIDVNTVRKLRRWSAGYQRVAIELEAASRCCRLVERDINQRVDALLAGREEAPSATTGDQPVTTRAAPRARTGLPGRLHGVFRRAASSPHRTVPIPAERLPSGALLTTAVDPDRAPVLPVPVADVAAWTLGPLEVYVAGQRVPRWNSLKARAVLQYLLIHQDRPIRRDVLMALQWPNHSHNSARNNLNVALYSLRNALDGLGQSAQPILYRDGCYVLNPELTWWIDRNE